MVCAVCGEVLVVDNGLGWLHPETMSMHGEDGHLVCPISEAAWSFVRREVSRV